MIIKLTKSFYNYNSIKQAVDAFGDFASFNISQELGQFIITVHFNDYKLNKNKQYFKDEFLNFVLGCLAVEDNKF